MSLLGSFSRSTSTTPSSYTKTAIGSVMTVLCPQIQTQYTYASSQRPRAQRKACHRQTRHYTHHHHNRNLSSLPSYSNLSHESAEVIFIQALARASLCRKHARPYSTRSSHSTHPTHYPHTGASPTHNSAHTLAHTRSGGRPSLSPHSSPHSRSIPFSPGFSTHHASKDAAQAMAAVPREELRAIVDLYDHEPDTFTIHTSPSPHTRRIPLHVPVEDIPPDHVKAAIETPVPTRDMPADIAQHKEQIRHLRKLLKDELTDHELLFDAYQALPHPRMSYLSDPIIRKLMHHFSVVEFRSENSMLRYLSLVDDLTAANIPLLTEEWNSAISFAGRWVRHVTDLQVETATQIWLRMEREAGVASDNVTFNILFDVAIKAGKFALADVIMKEMVTRSLPENSYFRTNKIYYCGLKGDGAAVRQAYKELVDAGEFVNTTVLNCVIVSLIRAGEASAAEFVFDRMKAIHVGQIGTKPTTRGWRKQRTLARILDKAARTLRNNPEQRLAVQEATPVTPDVHTYRLLIKYHAHESGNIDRVADLLDEMQEARIQMHGSIFYQLFKGFHLHGGVRYSSWTQSRLDHLWSVFLEFVSRTEEYNSSHPDRSTDEEDRGCYYDVGIVIVVLQAYNRVAGRDTALDVWHSILEKWSPEGEALDAINGALAKFV